jgi:predicted nucleic acid-binding protein
MKRVLFDTDVLLDFLFDRKPFSDQTLTLLLACQEKKIIGYLTPVIFSNMYYILRQQASDAYVKEKLGVLLSIVRVLPMNEQTVHLAINSSFKDIEDAMQYFCALKNANIDAILTRNTKDYKKSVIPVFLPSEWLSVMGQDLEN